MESTAASLQSVLHSDGASKQQERYIASLQEWNDSCEDVILSSQGRLDLSSDFKTNEIPIQSVALELLTVVQSFLQNEFPSTLLSSSSTTSKLDSFEAKSPPLHHQQEKLELLSEYLRAIKNLIRYNRLFLTSLKYLRKDAPKHKILMALAGISHMEAFCTIPMIHLYLHLLRISCSSPSIQQQSEEESERDDLLLETQQEVARNAAACLFHSTFGYATEPICKKALYALVSSSKNGLNGIPILANLLVSTSSTMTVPVLLGLLKNVHNLAGSFPGVQKEFDGALEMLKKDVGQLLVPNTPQDGEVHPPTGEETLPLSLLTILVTTLAWSIRSTTPTPFPGDQDDRRCELAKEIISILFALNMGPCSKQIKSSAENRNIMTQLGVLIVDILHLPKVDGRVHDLKLQVLILLLDVTVDTSSLDYTEFLLKNRAMDPLLNILEVQLVKLCVLQAGQLQSEEHSVPILPILIVLNKLSIANPVILHKVKSKLFTPDREEFFRKAVEELNLKGAIEAKVVAMNDTEGVKQTKTASVSEGKNMHPLDAPKGSLRYHLISLMTWRESNVKRCSSELLWTLCNKDPKEFVARTGFGNAVHMMGIKGFVSIPKS